MRNNNNALFMWFMFALIFLVQLAIHDADKKWQQSQDTRLDNFIHQQDSLQYRDSVHYEHMKNCSYIDRASVRVGQNGVLYSQYHIDAWY